MQKKNSSKNSEKKPLFTAAWFIFHIGIIVAFLISLAFTKGFHFDADFMTMMPSSNDSEAAKIAEEAISKNTGNSVFILSSNPDFQKAKSAAEKVYSELVPYKEKFLTLELYTDEKTVSELQNFLGKYRETLLTEKVQKEISENPAQFAENALANVFGGFSMVNLDNLEDDPFLFDEENLKTYLTAIQDSGTAMQPKDGVLATQFDGKWYVMIRGELTTEGVTLASKKNAVPLIYEKCFPLEEDGETHFAFFGTPFHSYKSSSSASAEISVISTISLLAVVIILLVIFRSGIPIVSSVFSIVASLSVAFCATHLFFGNLHLMTLVFGTSLIGSCIDYSIHFFTNWKGNKELKNGTSICRHLFHGLILSLISTELCYALLIFAPFAVLKQMAVFSFVGILSSFLTVTGLFASYKLPLESKRSIPILDKITFSTETPAFKIFGKVVIALIFISSVSILAIRHKDVKIQNDIMNLYKMEGRLKDDTIIAYQVLNYNPMSWLIVSGDTEEAVLQTEESVLDKIPDSYVCTARFIPSMKKQRESLAAIKNLLPYAQTQFEYLGFEEESANDYIAKIQSENVTFLTPDVELPATLKSLLKMLWVGKIGDKYYSIILPSTITDESIYKELARADENIYYENKTADISAGLDNLTRLIAIMFAVAFVIIFVIMKFLYNWRDTLKIVSIPFLSVLVIISVFVIAGLRIEFFCITGVILVFGLGLDYVIYKMENKKNSASKLELFAITLSFITTAISFGALALSSFIPVHVLGLSIFSGLITAFVCTML